jgi:excisionase family DNA binding protein
MTDAAGVEMVHLAEVARRVVALGYAPSMTGDRIAKLAKTDPDWPIARDQERRVGNRRKVPWEPLRAYFAARFAGRGSRPGPKGWARRKAEPKSTEPSSRRDRQPAPAAGRRTRKAPGRSGRSARGRGRAGTTRGRTQKAPRPRSRSGLPTRATEESQRSNRWAKAEWVTLAEVARRAVTELGYSSMSRQAVWDRANNDPDWPVDRAQWRRVGRSCQVPWPPVRYYLAKRNGRGVMGQPWLHHDPRRSAVERVTLVEAARRAVTELGYPSMTGETLGKLARTDPDWPVDRARVGPYWQLPWPPVRDYLANGLARRAQRTGRGRGATRATGPAFLRTGEVAGLLCVSPRTVERWVKQGKLPCLRTPGGHYRYPGEEIRALAERLFRQPGPPATPAATTGQA